jgi:hypothetical protein
MEKFWIFMIRIPRTATPLNTSKDMILSAEDTGDAFEELDLICLTLKALL